MQRFYLNTEKENSDFHRDILGEDFDLGISENSNDSINNIAHLNPLFQIKKLRTKNLERVIVRNLNINSLPKKFEQLKDTVLKYVDVLVLTETKLDDSFPKAQFLVERVFLDKAIDTYNNCDKILLIGDFNAETTEPCLESFLYEHDLQSLVKESTFQKC